MCHSMKFAICYKNLEMFWQSQIEVVIFLFVENNTLRVSRNRQELPPFKAHVMNKCNALHPTRNLKHVHHQLLTD